MNILFFILPKDKIHFVYDSYTLRQTIEKLDNTGYTSLPVLNNKGEYLFTVTEGDVLRYIKHNENMSLRNAEKIPLKSIPIKRDVKSIKIYANMEDLIQMSLGQNFVPVVDDMNHFIGIITRQSIINHFLTNIKEKE